ncbi:hypothetical protein SKAU_G00340610 [Synaphobranchus kaupii]|uniref:Thyroid peroxidase n=1 Tax=Synaphobranchus kaupii TaxID=118154 RepID=A0A9Q1EN39_SYNKA|nr:hypothetical protein SKAU_G00340610 [Synaphobranchus kaupii]
MNTTAPASPGIDPPAITCHQTGTITWSRARTRWPPCQTVKPSNGKQVQEASPLFTFQGNPAVGHMAPSRTTDREHGEGPVPSAVPAFPFRRQADPEMLEQSRAAQRLEWTLRDLKDRVKHRRARDTRASGKNHIPQGPPVMGRGEHRPSQVAAASIRGRRAVPPGAGTAVASTAVSPCPREISNVIMRDSGGCLLEDETYSQMLVDWGQYVDHDISFTPQSANQATDTAQPDCSGTCENTNPCFPIQVPPGDRLSSQTECLPFVRSSPVCPSSAGDVNDLLHKLRTGLWREQANGITSFLDASTVYGSGSPLELRLRDKSSQFGGLAINGHFTDRGQAHLPFVPDPPRACLPDPGGLPGKRGECLLAGDSRVNEVLSLSTLHTLWVREHNRLGYALKSLNPHWSTETTYQESRKIVGALHQASSSITHAESNLSGESFCHTQSHNVHPVMHTVIIHTKGVHLTRTDS